MSQTESEDVYQGAQKSFSGANRPELKQGPRLGSRALFGLEAILALTRLRCVLSVIERDGGHLSRLHCHFYK